MDLILALVIYFLILILIYLICRNYGIRRFSSLIFGLLISIIILGIMYPYPKAGLDMYSDKSKNKYSRGIIIYGLIQILTWVIILWYIIDRITKDYEKSII